jgi:hypothetical protein
MGGGPPREGHGLVAARPIVCALGNANRLVIELGLCPSRTEFRRPSRDPCEDVAVHRVVRLVTVADAAEPVDAGDISVSARHEAVLEDGSRVLLLDGRGWTESLRGPAAHEVDDLWAVTQKQDIVETARVVVGPDEPYGELSQEDMAAGHWETLAETLHAQGVSADAGALRRLPHDVELSDALLARLGGRAEPG